MISTGGRLALTLGLTLATGFAFTPLGCGSSGRGFSSAGSTHGDGDVPEGLARELRTCAVEHRAHVAPAQHTVTFNVKLANDGQVDSIALEDSTLGDQDLEDCMASALRSLSSDDLPLRRSDSRHRDRVTPGVRALLGQEEVLGCFASPPCLLTMGFVIGAAYIAVQVYVYATSPSTATKSKSQTTPIPTTMTTTNISLDECIARYVMCTERTPNAPCGDCLGYCRANKVWPEFRCP
jgi:hypothetical protein